MRPIRVALALVLLALAVFAALLAADVRSWHAAVRSGDARFARSPADARWSAATLLPFDPARAILDLADGLEFRRAAQEAIALQAVGNGIDNGYTESRARGALVPPPLSGARSFTTRLGLVARGWIQRFLNRSTAVASPSRRTSDQRRPVMRRPRR